MIQQPNTYAGNGQVYVGDGNSLPIKSTGDGILPTPSCPLLLKNILHVPGIKENLLSIAKMTRDNNCVFLLFPWGYAIKDLRTRRTIMEGPVRDNLYPISVGQVQALFRRSNAQRKASNKEVQTSNKEVAAVCSQASSQTLWHRRLGHPSLQVMSKLVVANDIPVYDSVPISVCEACQNGKSSRLPFPLSMRRTSVIMDLIHCDIWGPSLQSSVIGLLYYIVFVDDCSRYTWLYPMKAKSDSVTCFKH